MNKKILGGIIGAIVGWFLAPSGYALTGTVIGFVIGMFVLPKYLKKRR